MAIEKLGSVLRLPGGEPVQIIIPNGNRVQASATDTATAGAALPGGGGHAYVVASDFVYFLSGASNVAATEDASSDFLSPGENIVKLAAGATHFSVIAVGAGPVIVQVKGISSAPA